MNSFRIEQKPASPQKEFAHSLYQENLEKVSFLYEQRLGLLDDAEISWKDICDFEERLEAHIDGLVVGEKLALDVCRQQAIEGDIGELHSAVVVFCRQDRKDLLLKVLEGIDPEDAERTQAVSDALNYEPPDHWQNTFIQMLPECQPKDIPIIARLIGYQRLPVGKELLKVPPGKSSEELSAVIWALGRLRYQEARHLLLVNYLPYQDESVYFFTALALLRMGEPETLDQRYAENHIAGRNQAVAKVLCYLSILHNAGSISQPLITPSGAQLQTTRGPLDTGAVSGISLETAVCAA